MSAQPGQPGQPAEPAPPFAKPDHLQRGLKQRHLTMIAIGGVIGAGLFVGSSGVISKAGPAAFLTYGITGLMIVLVMQMLGEMSVANPTTGSFTDHARNHIGPWAGFSSAWLYWYFWVIVVGFEAVAGAGIIQTWIDLPVWLIALVLMVLMTASNLYSVRSYGEFEYWFAALKVSAIVLFLIFGLVYVLGLWPDSHAGLGTMTAHGGLFPNGVPVIFSGVVTAVFSMVGAEIATVAGAESEDPARSVAKATRTVVWRILMFFVGSMILITAIVPWNTIQPGDSPYAMAVDALGIPHAGDVMNAIVLVAVLSCLNSGLYTASRMLFVLADHGEAPKAVRNLNGRGVPVVAILASTLIGYLCVIAAAIAEDTIFTFLLNSSGAVILFVYVMIAFSQLSFRRKVQREGTELEFKMWGFPALTIIAIVAMLAVLVSMAFDPGVRSQIYLGLASWAVLLIIFFAIPSLRAKQAAASSRTAEPVD